MGPATGAGWGGYKVCSILERTTQHAATPSALNLICATCAPNAGLDSSSLAAGHHAHAKRKLQQLPPRMNLML